MNKVKIIAEAGVNHNGDVRIAKKMVEVAKECGADIVKFQTFNVSSLVSRQAGMAEYQKRNMGNNGSQEAMLTKLTLRKDEFVTLAEYCKEIGIRFLSTPFDIESIRFLENLQDTWKIPSGEITNYPYLVKIAKTGKDVILSTGMSTLEEVDAALDVLKSNGTGKITLLHCTTDYPAAMRDVNLKAMLTMKEHFGCDVGYSDHTLGIEIPIATVAMGATVVEKHFTLDKTVEGPDHKASLEPNELKQMVEGIRKIEAALGDGIKRVSESEKANVEIARKSVVAARNIKKGEKFTEENLTTKRPGNGISPMRWDEIMGKTAKREYWPDDLIHKDELEH